MRQLFVVTVVILTITAVRAETPGGKQAVITGPHICCGKCEKNVAAILAKVEGISDVVCDRSVKPPTVTFTAKDQAAAHQALDAMYQGGFSGSLKVGDTVATPAAPQLPKGKVNSVTFTKVHVCCGQCVTGVKKLFKDAEVTFEGKDAQKDVTITGTDLDPNMVLQRLREGGFNGTFVEKK
jgi:hypothetical protein